MNKFEHIDWLWPGSWKMLHWRVLTVPGVFDRSAFWETKGETAATFRETWGEPPWEVGWSTQKPLENLATENRNHTLSMETTTNAVLLFSMFLCPFFSRLWSLCYLLPCFMARSKCPHRSLQDLLAFAEAEDLKIEPWMRWNPEISCWVILRAVREVLGVIVDGC